MVPEHSAHKSDNMIIVLYVKLLCIMYYCKCIILFQIFSYCYEIQYCEKVFGIFTPTIFF